jgi:hypothetical protein
MVAASSHMGVISTPVANRDGETAGLTMGAIYSAFTSKEHLIAEAGGRKPA